MRYTNKYNIPEHICQWLATDEYDYVEDAISITTLIGPPRAWALKRLFHEELTVDYSDLISMRYGTALHDSLGKLEVVKPGDFREVRFTAKLGQWTITGKPDAVTNGVLRDFKSTSAWKYVMQEFDPYIKQLSGYRWLLYMNGIKVPETAYIDFLFTDWKRSDARKHNDYPPTRYAEAKLLLWTLDDTEQWLLNRLEAFERAKETLPFCTDEELWKPPTTYAVMKDDKAKRATRVFPSREEARAYTNAYGGIVKQRIGIAKRCAYCAASPFCQQYDDLARKELVDA